ncbi:TetR/AcrR family transcriptional regulator [Paenibacillus ginsengarvi]|uniref:TetR/AcrR family transcriptional regulator n=1 Tax=Paenibacillus ginsengarvi TaxID=400777 RepID=A0A3B0B249_9BACL|nr:TetR/AcrR family transcriptional regulator [Paenibacillus ginsengarvi]RKN66074.1 TetR/AcrR family transcriptional regulator [Paenibacillus ginsengarvi]
MKYQNEEPQQPQGSKPATPTSAAASRREERDNEYRQRILATATELFQKQGIDCVTMYQLAQEAGVGQGTLYRRYTHLGEVCSDLLHTTFESFLQELEDSVAATAPEVPAMQQLAGMIERSIDFIDQKASLLNTIHSMYTEKKSYIIHEKPIFRRLHELIRPLLVRAVEQGEIRDIDITLTINTLLVALTPNQYLYHRDVLGYDKIRFRQGICRLFVEGL